MVNVLVVDDDPMIAAIVSMVLEEAGYDVSVAENGDEALSALARNADIALIISDQNMPGIDGIALFHRLRSEGSAVPFILLSGEDLDTLRTKAPEISLYMAKDEALPDIIADTVTRLLAPIKG